jgi:hypothetical protein
VRCGDCCCKAIYTTCYKSDCSVCNDQSECQACGCTWSG